MKENERGGGLGLPIILFIVFLTLKLTNNINWSWWWVTSPLWIPIAFVGALIVIIAFFYAIHNIFKEK